MQWQNRETHLLEHLRDRAGCDYMSDLRSVWFWGELYRALMRIEPEAFSQAEWRDAAQYILRLERVDGDAEQIRRQMLDAMLDKTG